MSSIYKIPFVLFIYLFVCLFYYISIYNIQIIGYQIFYFIYFNTQAFNIHHKSKGINRLIFKKFYFI